MGQFGFLVNTKNCVGCKACEIACKSRNKLESPGPRLRVVTTTVEGKFPDTKVTHLSTACMHCENPACVAVCPAGAITKRDDGSVVADQTKCIGCQACNAACPWGVPQYRLDDGTMIKCDSCADRRAAGLDPACMHTCFYGALFAGDVDDLMAQAQAMGGTVEQLEGETGPSVLVVS